MVNRSAPANGYDFGNKRQYRRNIWRTFANNLGLRSECRVLLMPSCEGDEVDVALRAGFRLQNMHLVDRNAAIAAHLKRRFPLATTYGVPLARAAQRIAKAGIRLSAANLDLCNNINERMFDELSAFASEDIFCVKAFVAVTMLRGRERSRQWLDVADDPSTIAIDAFSEKPRKNLPPTFYELTKEDQSRLICAGTFLCGASTREASYNRERLKGVLLLRFGQYRSAAWNQTMLWGIYKLTSVPAGKAYLNERARYFEASTASCLSKAQRLLLEANAGGLLSETELSGLSKQLSILRDQLSAPIS